MCGTHPSKEQYPFEHPLFDLRHNTALYSSGGAAGVTDYGPNAGKTVDSMQFGGDGYSYLTVTKDGYVKEYNVVGSEVGTFSLIQNPDGSSRLKGMVTTNTNDGTTTVKEIDSTHKGGKTHTTVSEKTTRADGSSTEKKTETETDDDCDADCMEVIEAGDDYTDPDCIGFDIVTPGDMARLETRIKWIRTPAPDWGDTGGPQPEPPTSGQCWPNCGGDKTLILMDPDGVVVVATGGMPLFNRRTQPDYDPWLDLMSGIAGQPVPEPITDPARIAHLIIHRRDRLSVSCASTTCRLTCADGVFGRYRVDHRVGSPLYVPPAERYARQRKAADP